MWSSIVFFEGDGDHRDLHVLTPSFPTRRSADLEHPGQAPRRSPLDLRLKAEGDEKCGRARRCHTGSRGQAPGRRRCPFTKHHADFFRSEEHTSELQSLMRSSYDVFCLKKKITTIK